jgi:hypothetical protein
MKVKVRFISNMKGVLDTFKLNRALFNFKKSFLKLNKKKIFKNFLSGMAFALLLITFLPNKVRAIDIPYRGEMRPRSWYEFYQDLKADLLLKRFSALELVIPQAMGFLCVFALARLATIQASKIEELESLLALPRTLATRNQGNFL